ncbi:hypothetical protein J1N35_002206 [Gossypium stocksii]|uniref:Uncharacterized protein n=1 Tax=Gossypium stocksii TaxID=47602 RepID=A0A9D3WM06_9ROSI|nr:hypothetical protein J1N35_002206 [Gossypium stocksii]
MEWLGHDIKTAISNGKWNLIRLFRLGLNLSFYFLLMIYLIKIACFFKLIIDTVVEHDIEKSTYTCSKLMCFFKCYHNKLQKLFGDGLKHCLEQVSSGITQAPLAE